MTSRLQLSACLIVLTGTSLTFAACAAGSDEQVGGANNELNAVSLHCTLFGGAASVDVTPGTASVATLKSGPTEFRFDCQPSAQGTALDAGDGAIVVATCVAQDHIFPNMTITKKGGEYKAEMAQMNVPPWAPQALQQALQGQVTFACSEPGAHDAAAGAPDAATD
jgi:hypothetical protein